MAEETLVFGTPNSTMYTTLMAEGVQLCPIKDYPDLGGAPEQVETTTLDDSQATYVTGVQQVDRLEFTANYTPEAYKAAKTIQDKTESTEFTLAFGSSKGGSQYGSFTWSGQLSVWVVGGGVNGVREMRISITAGTAIEYTEPTNTSSY